MNVTSRLARLEHGRRLKAAQTLRRPAMRIEGDGYLTIDAH
jgi:hypothetical protein